MTFDRRPLGRNGHVLVDLALERDGFLAAFTERSGGESPAPFDSLDLSFFVGDDEDLVRENRRRTSESLGLDAFATAEQVHGARVSKVGEKRKHAGYAEPAGRIPGADAMSTSTAGVALAVLTADCVPIVAASPAQGLVIAAHAGWRGIAGGIVGEVARVFRDPKDVRVAIGPAIGPDHYEVGEDVALAVAAGTEAGATTERRDGRLFLDLVGTIRSELRRLGIRRVEDTGLCTACESRRFFSYRRDGVTGRQAGFARKLS
jgi:YfiH family protein